MRWLGARKWLGLLGVVSVLALAVIGVTATLTPSGPGGADSTGPVAKGVLSVALSAPSDWWQEFGFGPPHGGDNPGESAISVSNVSTLVERFSAAAGSNVDASPAIVNGVAYIARG